MPDAAAVVQVPIDRWLDLSGARSDRDRRRLGYRSGHLAAPRGGRRRGGGRRHRRRRCGGYRRPHRVGRWAGRRPAGRRAQPRGGKGSRQPGRRRVRATRHTCQQCRSLSPISGLRDDRGDVGPGRRYQPEGHVPVLASVRADHGRYRQRRQHHQPCVQAGAAWQRQPGPLRGHRRLASSCSPSHWPSSLGQRT